jgi:hypothetical protein
LKGREIEVAHNFYDIINERIMKNQKLQQMVAISSDYDNLDEIIALEESMTTVENVIVSLTPIKQGHITLLTEIDNVKNNAPIIVTVENFPAFKVLEIPNSTIPGTFLKFVVESNFKTYNKFEENIIIKIVDSSKRFLRYKHLNSRQLGDEDNQDEPNQLESTFGFTPNRPGTILLFIISYS